MPGEQGCIEIARGMMDKMRRYGSAAAEGTAIGWTIQQITDAVRDHPKEPSKGEGEQEDDQRLSSEECRDLYVQCYEDRWETGPHRCEDCARFCRANGYWPWDRCYPLWSSTP